MTSSSKRVQVHYYSAVALSFILAIMPFHALFSVWLGLVFGAMASVQAWKEVVILIIAIVIFVTAVTKKHWPVPNQTVNLVVYLIIGLAIVISLVFKTNLKLFLFGYKTDLEPLVVFLIGQIVGSFFSQKKIIGLVIVPAAIVVVFGLVQAYFLPVSWLTHLGYSGSTIAPVQLVDPSLKTIRVFSSLGGPNQLGNYLVLPLMLELALLIKQKKPLWLVLLALTSWVLFLSYSRSGWLAAGLGIIVMMYLASTQSLRKVLLVGASLMIILLSLLTVKLYHDPPGGRLQYYLFHRAARVNNTVTVEQARQSSLTNALDKVKTNPFGSGLGTAGPASFRSQHPIITENWYLQIAIEISLIGLGLYLIFFFLNGMFLWQQVKIQFNPLAAGLLASLIGLSFSNLFLHTWTDSTLALIFFSLLGIVRTMKP